MADGAAYIDMSECQNIVDFFRILIQKLGLSTQPEHNQILYDTYLKQKRSALVVANIPKHDDDLVKEFIRFVKRLKYETNLVQILIVEPDQAKDLRL